MKALKPRKKRKYRPKKDVKQEEFNREMNAYFGVMAQRNTPNGVKVYNAMNVLKIKSIENDRFKVFVMPNTNFYLFVIMMLSISALAYFVEDYEVDGKPVDKTSRLYMVIGSLVVCALVIYFTITSRKKLIKKALGKFQLTKV